MMRTINAASAEHRSGLGTLPGDVLHGVRLLGHSRPLPEMDEQVIVVVISCWHCWHYQRFHGRVIGLNHGRNTYTVKVGEMIQEKPE